MEKQSLLKNKSYTFEASLWRYSGPSGWYFVTLPRNLSCELKDKFGQLSRSWGSLPVVVTSGTSTWSTSIFADTKSGGYLLPIKASIRKKERLNEGDELSFSLEVVV